MRIDVVHIDHCPSWVEAGDRVRRALALMGISDADVTFRLVRTSEEAAGQAFAGSPTILLDDEDLFPGHGATTQLACRIYQTPTGLAGLPTLEQITAAIDAHGR